jgi:two-component system chemotaxis response regulator CheY
MKVLLVDDSATMRRIQKTQVNGLGITDIVEAGDGSEALIKLQENMPVDIIMLDWNMPVMDGFEFLKELRQMEGGNAPKVVFCTTENDIAQIAKALKAGANEYIMKPFDRDIVEAKFAEAGIL